MQDTVKQRFYKNFLAQANLFMVLSKKKNARMGIFLYITFKCNINAS